MQRCGGPGACRGLFHFRYHQIMGPTPRHRTIAGWACALLLVVTCAAYASNAWWSIRRYDSSARTWGLGNGTIGVMWATLPLPSDFHQPPPRWMFGRRTGPFFWWQFSDSSMPGIRVVILPLWIPTLVLASLTTILLWEDLARRHRRRRGLCPSCGYDRRGLATPTTKCPECGTKREGKPAGSAFPV
jgi:hypothetical protein